MGKPIVDSIEDILSAFFCTGLDGLVINDLILMKKWIQAQADDWKSQTRALVQSWQVFEDEGHVVEKDLASSPSFIFEIHCVGFVLWAIHPRQ